MISQLIIVNMRGRIARFRPRFPVYDLAAFQDYFSHVFNEHIDVSYCEITEGTTHPNKLPGNKRHKDFSLAKFCASSR